MRSRFFSVSLRSALARTFSVSAAKPTTICLRLSGAISASTSASGSTTSDLYSAAGTAGVDGVAGAVHQPAGRFAVRYAWVSARWGSLPLEGGIEAAYRAEIEAAADPAGKLREIEDRLNLLRSPFRTAETFWVEQIIDPRETRRLLSEFTRLARPLLTPGKASFTARP